MLCLVNDRSTNVDQKFSAVDVVAFQNSFRIHFCADHSRADEKVLIDCQQVSRLEMWVWAWQSNFGVLISQLIIIIHHTPHSRYTWDADTYYSNSGDEEEGDDDEEVTTSTTMCTVRQLVIFYFHCTSTSLEKEKEENLLKQTVTLVVVGGGEEFKWSIISHFSLFWCTDDDASFILIRKFMCLTFPMFYDPKRRAHFNFRSSCDF